MLIEAGSLFFFGCIVHEYCGIRTCVFTIKKMEATLGGLVIWKEGFVGGLVFIRKIINKKLLQ